MENKENDVRKSIALDWVDKFSLDNEDDYSDEDKDVTAAYNIRPSSFSR